MVAAPPYRRPRNVDSEAGSGSRFPGTSIGRSSPSWALFHLGAVSGRSSSADLGGCSGRLRDLFQEGLGLGELRLELKSGTELLFGSLDLP